MAKMFGNIKKFPSQIGHQFQKLHNPMKSSEKRANLRKELFSYMQCAQFGFPEKASMLAYDVKLNLLAIATKDGVLKVFGAPGVEYGAQHVLPKNVEVRQVVFVPQQARLLTLTSDWVLHHWEMNNDVLEEVRKLVVHDGSALNSGKSAEDGAESSRVPTEESSDDQSGVKHSSAWLLSLSGDQLFVGSDAGSLYIVAVSQDSLRLVEMLTSDDITASIPSEQRHLLRLGSLVHISQSPTHPQRILLGFELGTSLVYNLTQHSCELLLPGTQVLTDAAWLRNGEFVKSCHQDGSYVVWPVGLSFLNLVVNPLEAATIPYGPFPCKAITKLFWKTSKLGNFVVFAGGMPRASYGDKHTVSVIRGADEHVCFDLPSRVMDIQVACGALNENDGQDGDFDEPHTMFILCEEELVVVDLRSAGWPIFELPYLQSVPSSGVTALCHVAGVHCASIASSLRDLKKKSGEMVSQRTWPVSGGRVLYKSKVDTLPARESAAAVVVDTDSCTVPKEGPCADELILTGHEDGSVAFWTLQAARIHLNHILKTSALFSGQFGSRNGETAEEDDWPPFRGTGRFHPFIDDKRLAITSIDLVDDLLLLGGAAGQFSTWCINHDKKEIEVDMLKITAEIVHKEKESDFVWKGPHSLVLQEGIVEFAAGWHPTCMVQVLPPSPVFAVAAAANWQLIAVGTAHGLAVIDIDTRATNRLIYTHSTMPAPTDSKAAAASQNADSDTLFHSRGKKLRQSLRQSFRKLRKTTKSPPSADSSSEKPFSKPETLQPDSSPIDDKKELVDQVVDAAQTAHFHEDKSPETSNVDDAAKSAAAAAESTEDEAGVACPLFELDKQAGAVRCLRFATTCLSGSAGSPSLWAGTSSCHVFGFHLSIPTDKEHRSDKLRVQLSKDIHLKHAAPVVQLFLVDRNNTEASCLVESVGRDLLVVSEEQVKLFTLPSLKPRYKNKMASVDGARLRAAGLARFVSTRDASYTESALLVANSLDQVVALNLPKLVRQSTGLFGGANGHASLVTLGVGNEQRPFGVSLVDHRLLRFFSMTAAIASSQHRPLDFTVDVAEDMRPASKDEESKKESAEGGDKKNNVDTTAEETLESGDIASTDADDVVSPATLTAPSPSERCYEKHDGDITLDIITEHVTNAKNESESERKKVVPLHIVDNPYDTELSLEEKHCKIEVIDVASNNLTVVGEE